MVQTPRYSSQTRVFIIGWVSFLLAGAHHLGAATAPEILKAYDGALNTARMWSMDVTVSVTWKQSDPAAPGGPSPDVTHFLYIRDGDSRDVAGTILQDEHKELVGAGQRAIENGWFLSYDLPSKGPPENAFFANNGKRFVPYVSPEPAMEGFACDPDSITTILRQARDMRILPGSESIDGHRCVAISGNAVPFGCYTLWCDPEIGYLPRKIVIEKKGDDLFEGRKIAERRVRFRRNMVPVSEVVYTADLMQYQTFKNVVLPVSCRSSTKTELADGNWHTIVHESVRSNVNLQPVLDHAVAFRPDVPEGTRLTNLEDQQIPYQWRGGKPVPYADPSVVHHMDATADQYRREPDGAKSTSGK